MTCLLLLTLPPFEETKLQTPQEDPGREDPAPVKAAGGENLSKSSLCVLLWGRRTPCAHGAVCALTQRASQQSNTAPLSVKLEDVQTASSNKSPSHSTTYLYIFGHICVKGLLNKRRSCCSTTEVTPATYCPFFTISNPNLLTWRFSKKNFSERENRERHSWIQVTPAVALSALHKQGFIGKQRSPVSDMFLRWHTKDKIKTGITSSV